MNKLTQAKRVQIIAALVEGNSIRATCRMTGAAKGTVLKLVVDLGKACAAYQDRTLRNLTCKKKSNATRSGRSVMRRNVTSRKR